MEVRGWIIVLAVVAVPVTAGTVAALVPMAEPPRVIAPPLLVQPEPLPSAPSAPSAAAAAVVHGVESNVLPADYVGPKTCEPCHAERFKQWSQHSHSRMNQNATPASVLGDFKDARIKLSGGEVSFTSGASGYQMTLERGGKTVRRYLVTRTVGSRFMQFYIGKQLEGPEPKYAEIYTTEHKLPFAYWFKLKRWLPEAYFDPLEPDLVKLGKPPPDPFDTPIVFSWAENCMLCHNTYPYAFRLASPGGRRGYPDADLEFSGAAMRATIAAAPNPRGAITSTPGSVRAETDLVTLGVSCESCHFGGRQHAATGGPQSWVPKHAQLQISPHDARVTATSSRENAYVVNSTCRQCHSANGETFANGAGIANSREALDLLAGACNPKVKCTDCHDPHVTTGREAQPVSAKHLGVCVKCHDKYGDAAVADKHMQHPAGAHVTCLDCHMPRITQGLDEVVRSHRISSPADPRMLGTDQPNACNLCHLDRSIAWTLGALDKGWGKKVTPGGGTNPSAPNEAAGRAWLRSKNPGLRLVTTQAWANSPLGRTATRDVLPVLDDLVPVNRMFASFAIERITGVPLGSRYDPTAPPDVRAIQIKELGARVP